MALARCYLPLLAAIVTALACAGCSDDRGGTAGPSAGGGGTGGGGSPQGGSAGSLPSRAGLQLSLHAPSPAIPNTECFAAGETAIGAPPPTLDPLDAGGAVGGGDLDVSVVCSVVGADTYSVSAVIARDALRFKVSNGTIDASAGTGTFKLLIDTPEAGDIVSEVDRPCTFDVSEPPLEVGEGTLFATFQCPVLWNHATATDTACGADGALVLELCRD